MGGSAVGAAGRAELGAGIGAGVDLLGGPAGMGVRRSSRWWRRRCSILSHGWPGTSNRH